MIRKNLKYITYLSICLLVFSTSLMASATSLLNKNATGDSSERILFCTPEGIKWVTLASLSLEADSEEIPAISTHHDCPFCTSDEYFIDGALFNSSLSLTLNPCATKSHRADLISFTLSENYLNCIRAIRAPPIFT